MTTNLKNDIPEPFRKFLGGTQKEQEISATNIDTDSVRERNGRDMQDLLFLAAILLLCDD